MSDPIPRIAHEAPFQVGISWAYRVGAKCVVSEIGEGWFCAHGTDGMGRDESRDIAPEGSIGIDRKQACIYFRPGSSKNEPEAIVVSPDNTPFLTAAKGFVEGGDVGARIPARRKSSCIASLAVAVTVVVVPTVVGEIVTAGPPAGPSIPSPAYQSTRFDDHW